MRPIILAFGLAACGGPTQPAAAPGPASSSREIATAPTPSVSAPAAPASTEALPAPSPDQSGEPRQVDSTASVVDGELVIDLQSDGWPGRAHDPELRVGQHVLTEYHHTAPTTLRFQVPPGVELVPGTQAVVWYGDDAYAQTTLPAEVAP